MNKIRLLPMALILIMALTAIAFADGTDSIGSPHTQKSPDHMNDPLFIGAIQSANDETLLTTGLFGLEGEVLVHLPQDRDQSLEFPEGSLLSITYDGMVAESDPQQVWAVSIIAVEEDHVVSLDPMEHPAFSESETPGERIE